MDTQIDSPAVTQLKLDIRREDRAAARCLTTTAELAHKDQAMYLRRQLEDTLTNERQEADYHQHLAEQGLLATWLTTTQVAGFDGDNPPSVDQQWVVSRDSDGNIIEVTEA